MYPVHAATDVSLGLKKRIGTSTSKSVFGLAKPVEYLKVNEAVDTGQVSVICFRPTLHVKFKSSSISTQSEPSKYSTV
jgi:hypothetical protein